MWVIGGAGQCGGAGEGLLAFLWYHGAGGYGGKGWWCWWVCPWYA